MKFVLSIGEAQTPVGTTMSHSLSNIKCEVFGTRAVMAFTLVSRFRGPMFVTVDY